MKKRASPEWLCCYCYRKRIKPATTKMRQETALSRGGDCWLETSTEGSQLYPLHIFHSYAHSECFGCIGGKGSTTIQPERQLEELAEPVAHTNKTPEKSHGCGWRKRQPLFRPRQKDSLKDESHLPVQPRTEHGCTSPATFFQQINSIILTYPMHSKFNSRTDRWNIQLHNFVDANKQIEANFLLLLCLGRSHNMLFNYNVVCCRLCQRVFKLLIHS